jgi:hypothetical protein
MPPPTLPNLPLAETARVGLRKLARYEESLLHVSFEGRVTDFVATVNGRGDVTSLVVPAAQVPTTGGSAVIEWIRQALASALGLAIVHANDRLRQQMPVLDDAGPPHRPDLSRHARHLIHDPYTGTSSQGRVQVTMSLSWVPTFSVANAFYTSPDRPFLGDRLREAANIAMASMRGELDCAAPGFAQILIQRGL